MRGSSGLLVVSWGVRDAARQSVVRMAPTDLEVAAAEEWLGGVRGGRSLMPLIKEALLHAFEEELWTMDDTSSPEDVSVEVLAVWETIFEAMATWEGEGEGEDAAVMADLRGTNAARFKLWIKSRDVMDDPPSKEEARKRSRALSEQCIKDMLDQGAHGNFEHFAWGCTSFFLGRPAGETETADFEHGQPVGAMKVGLHAAKYKRPTWNTEVEKAVNEHSLARLESFFSVWAVKMNQSRHPYGAVFTGVALQWWNQTKRAHGSNVRALLAYVQEYMRMYEGRGFPLEFDMLLMQVAAAEDIRKQTPGAGGASGGGGGSEAVAVKEQVSEMVKLCQSLKDTVGSLKESVNSMKSSQERLGSRLRSLVSTPSAP